MHGVVVNKELAVNNGGAVYDGGTGNIRYRAVDGTIVDGTVEEGTTEEVTGEEGSTQPWEDTATSFSFILLVFIPLTPIPSHNLTK